AVWGSVIAGMAALGPLLGGWLRTHVDWRWIFWINLPIGVAIIIGILTLIPEARHPHAPPLDPVGVALSATGFGALVLGLIEGGTHGWWVPIAPFTAGSFTWGPGAPISMPGASIILAAVSLGVLLWWLNRVKVAGG